MVYACYISLCLCLHTVFPVYPTTTSLVSNTHQQLGHTPLYVASEKGNSKTVELLLQYKAEPDKATKVTKCFYNPGCYVSLCLCLHTVFPDYPTTTSLVSNTHQQLGYTPLYIASEKGNSKTVDLLLQYKATPDKATKVTKYLHNH